MVRYDSSDLLEQNVSFHAEELMKKLIILAVILGQIYGLSYAKEETVSSDAVLKSISPNGDGLYEKTRFIFTVSKNKVKKWTLEIKNDLGIPVKMFAGEGNAPVTLEWDGKDEKGAVVPDG
jgi:flagellar hook assembly protein FlgD